MYIPHRRWDPKPLGDIALLVRKHWQVYYLLQAILTSRNASRLAVAQAGVILRALWLAFRYEGHMFASAERLALQGGVSKKAYYRAIEKLREYGLVRTVRTVRMMGGTQSTLAVDFEPLWQFLLKYLSKFRIFDVFHPRYVHARRWADGEDAPVRSLCLEVWSWKSRGPLLEVG